MKMIQLRKSFPSLVVLFCLITSGTVHANPAPAPDELDEVINAANAGVTTLNDFLRVSKEQIATTRINLTAQSSNLRTTTAAMKSLIELLKAAAESKTAFRKEIRDRATAEALASLVEAAKQEREAAENDYAAANVEGAITAIPFVASQKSAASLANSVAVEFAKLLEEAKSQETFLEDRIRALEEQIAALKALAQKIEKVAQAIESLLPKLLDLIGKVSDATKTKACFSHIGQDRTYAAKLLAAVRANLNNAPALGQFLRNQTPGSNIDVREVKETTGLIVILRTGGLTHCLSTKQQCGGKPYTLVR